MRAQSFIPHFRPFPCTTTTTDRPPPTTTTTGLAARFGSVRLGSARPLQAFAAAFFRAVLVCAGGGPYLGLLRRNLFSSFTTCLIGHD